MRSSRRWFLGLGLAGLTSSLIGNGLYGFNNPYRRRIAALREAGYPVSFGDLIPTPVPDASNGLQILKDATPALESFFAIDYDPETLTIADKRLPELTAEDFVAIQRKLAAHPELVPMVSEIIGSPVFFADITTFSNSEQLLDAIPDIGAMRNVARYLRQRAYFLFSVGDYAATIECCADILRLAHQPRDPAVAINEVISYAFGAEAAETAADVMGAAHVPTAALSSLLTIVREVEFVARFKRMLSGERAFILGATDENLRKEVWRNPFSITSCCATLDNFEAQFELIEQPYAAFRTWLQKQKKVKHNRFSVETVSLDFFEGLRIGFENNRAKMRCLEVLIALQSHIASGDQPDITDLGLPNMTITDPFTEAPLILRYTEQGPTVYSVGADLADDGGSLENRKDVGLGPFRAQPAEVSALNLEP